MKALPQHVSFSVPRLSSHSQDRGEHDYQMVGDIASLITSALHLNKGFWVGGKALVTPTLHARHRLVHFIPSNPQSRAEVGVGVFICAMELMRLRQGR